MDNNNQLTDERNPRGAGRKAKPFREKKMQVWTSLTLAEINAIEEKGHTLPEYLALATKGQMQRDGILQQ